MKKMYNFYKGGMIMYYKKIELLMKAVMDNKISRGGVPMAAIMFDYNGTVIGKTMTNIRKGDISKEGSDKHQHHAEQLIKQSQQSLPNKFVLISILPPCIDCLNAISDGAEKVDIYYLTDSIRKRCESGQYNKELNAVKSIVSIQYLDVHKKWWNKIKIYYWYMVANLLHSSLNHIGVNKESLRLEIDEFISKIESKIYSENSRKEITFIKKDLEFLKSDDEYKREFKLKD